MTHKRTDKYEVDPAKLEEAYDRINRLLLKMFGTDYSSDPNVEFTLVDRQRQNRLQYIPVPYDHLNPDGSEAQSKEERVKALEASMEVAKFNVDVANNCFDTLFSIWKFHRQERQKEERAKVEKK